MHHHNHSGYGHKCPQESHDIALFRAVTPLPQRLQGFFGIYFRLLSRGGGGFVFTSPLLKSSNRVDVCGETL